MSPLNNMVDTAVSGAGGKILRSYIEKDVVLTTRVVFNHSTWSIVFRGRVDYAALVQLKSHLFTLLFEVTEYMDATETVKHRLLAYASALYGELGFPVIPVLLIVRDQDRNDDLLIMKSRTPVPGAELKKAVYKLARVLSASEDLKPARAEICAVCDPSIRRMCQYAH